MHLMNLLNASFCNQFTEGSELSDLRPDPCSSAAFRRRNHTSYLILKSGALMLQLSQKRLQLYQQLIAAVKNAPA